MVSTRSAWAAILVSSAVLLCGCGSQSDPRFDVSGSATFAGNPIPSGSILFEPDAAKGNHGPAGFATIKDGKYDTAVDGKGTIGGPHIVKLLASNVGSNVRGAMAASLFSDYHTPVDLPKETSTQNFDVPASAKLPESAMPGPDYQGP